MTTAKLTEQQVETGPQKLEGWSVVGGNLHRVFEFEDSRMRSALWRGSRSQPRKWITIRTGRIPGTRSQWTYLPTALVA